MKNEKLVQGALIVGMVLILAGTAFYVVKKFGYFSINKILQSSPITLKTFASADEFRAYAQASTSLFNNQGWRNTLGAAELNTTGTKIDTSVAAPGVADRSSTTNVQVAGIDEPDMVKTNGQQIFISQDNPYYILGREGVVTDSGVTLEQQKQIDAAPPSSGSAASDQPVSILPVDPKIIPPIPTVKTNIVNAFPPTSLALASSVEQSGNLLLSDKTMMVFSFNSIVGYDVRNPTSPVKKWSSTLGTNEQIVTSRLRNNVLYLVTQSFIQRDQPCPYQPLTVDGTSLAIPCANIYHPIKQVPIDATYTALVINPATGEVTNQLAFVGSSNSTVVYMSDTALYVTYQQYQDPVQYQYAFYTGDGQGLLPADIRSKMTKVQGYDLSTASKMNELQIILGDYRNSLSSANQQKFQTDFDKQFSAYHKKHQREYSTTAIAKISLSDWQMSQTGEVPGQLLNQFSLDEYQGTLRLATTSGDNFFFGQSNTVNDVYTLDGNLRIIGSVRDLAPGERIYSARFVGDRGYVVTFKQIDPFFVLDLSNPAKPTVAGQLKIPGFSSYLHLLKENFVLGVGQDNLSVKLSLFDVTKADQPVEISKLVLNESWSEVQSNYHAFLQDDRHLVFFLPAGNNGHVISYNNNVLTDVKTTDNIQAQRVVYINDFLYLVAQNKIVVLNENDWTTVKELAL